MHMAGIENDDDFRQPLKNMEITAQRMLAARFVENVLPLSDDDRIRRVIEIAAKADASRADVSDAFHTARTATIDSHNRCGADADWKAQAGYFVARAALAAVTPPEQMAGGPAFQAAMSSRMARTCVDIESSEDTAGRERQAQYRILTEFLNTAE
jgi:hypothetical protein